MQNQGDVWTGFTTVPYGDVANIELLWSENLSDSDEPLKLAVYRHTTGPITRNSPLPLKAEDYDKTEFDDDDDGVFNLDERVLGSDPRIASGEDSLLPDGVIDVRIKRINSSISPIVNGLYDSVWDNGATWGNTSDESLAIDNLIRGSDDTRADGETEFQWAALHDSTYLYLFIFGEYVDTGYQSMHADSEYVWDDDTIELFLDGDNSKGPGIDGIDDYQMFIPLLKMGEPFAANNFYDHDNRKYAGNNNQISAPWPDGVEFVNHINSPGDGRRHTWEIRIELSKVGINVGSPFGIELQYSDDQDSGNRDAKWAWKGVIDSAYENPGLLGTAILE